MERLRHIAALLSAALLFPLSRAAASPAVSLLSPGGTVEVSLTLEKRDGKEGVPVYRMSFKGEELVAPSRLGLDMAGGGPLDGGFSVVSVDRRETDAVSAVLFGKRSSARERYREAAVSLRENGPEGRALDIIFRAYDDGIAFRYSFPEQKDPSGLGIKEELTEFVFAGGPTAYYLPLAFASPYETYYERKKLKKLKAGVQLGLPMLLEYPGGTYAAVAEAELTDYAGLYLVTDGRRGFRSRLAPSLSDPSVKVRGTAPFSSPWRVIMAGTGPAALLGSDLIYQLNPPSALADTSWIEPGKIVFGWWNGYYMPDAPPFVPGVNTPTIMRYIDFAAANGIPFVSLDGTNDEAWYGGPIGYAGQDVTKANPNLDLEKVFAYARGKGVKVRIWLHWQGLEKDMERTLATYEKWGVSGIMVDFIDGDSQERVRFVQKIVEEAAKHRLSVNFHGIYKPTGVRRTYPNLLSYEAVLGTEYNKWDPVGSTPEHELLTLFIRMIAGPLDVHQGSFHPVLPAEYAPRNLSPMTIGTLARQLASFVLYENPLPMLADSPSAYEGKPALKFIREVPVVWDDTKVIAASFGRYLAIARREGADWYIGCVTDGSARKLKLPLDFLPPGEYAAEAYYDGKDADKKPEAVDIKEFTVSRSDTLRVKLAPAGGCAIKLSPAGGISAAHEDISGGH